MTLAIIVLGAIGIIANLPRPALAESPPVFLGQWGADVLSSPIGICVDPVGNVYVTNSGNHKVMKYSATGTLLGEVGTFGNGDAQFNVPVDVLATSDGRTYATDMNPGQMRVFDGALNFVTRWAPEYVGATRIAVDPAERFIYATLYTNSVYQYTVEGALVRQWSSGDPRNSELSGIAVGPSGAVYVADWKMRRIRKYTSDGEFILDWGGEVGLGLAVDADENVFVTSVGVIKFDQYGALLTQWGAVGSGEGEFLAPSDIAVSASGLIYVLDKGNNRVQLFGDTSIDTQITTWGRLKALYR